VAIVLLIVAAAVVAAKLLPIGQWFLSFLEWIDGLGAWAPALVAAGYAVATVLFVPGSVLTLGAGVLFGPVVGTIVVSIGSTLGACGAFLVGRTVARRSIERKVAGNPKFAAIDEAVGRQGFKIVLLTRLSPVFPFIFLNYAYGLTKVPFWRYALASWIGMLPGTFMYVYLGSALGSLAEAVSGRQESSVAERVFFVAGLVMAVVVAVVVTRVARKALKTATEAG